MTRQEIVNNNIFAEQGHMKMISMIKGGSLSARSVFREAFVDIRTTKTIDEQRNKVRQAIDKNTTI